jgi:hypothetical protein
VERFRYSEVEFNFHHGQRDSKVNMSLNAVVAQLKNYPFGVSTAIELKNI